MFISVEQTVVDSFCQVVSVSSNPCSGLSAQWTYSVFGDSVIFSSSDTGNNLAHSWNFGDGNTGTGPVEEHIYSANGNYNVCQYVTINGANCTDTSCTSIQIVTGINAPKTEINEVRIEPNPFNQATLISVNSAPQNCVLRVYDLEGKLLTTQYSVNNFFIFNRGNFQSGMYLFVVTANEMTLGKGKMVIE